MHEVLLKRPPIKTSLVVAVLAGVGLWMFLRSDKAAALADADPAMVSAVAALLPQIKSPTNTVKVKFLTQSDGAEAARKLEAEAVSPIVVRKSGKAYTAKNALGVKSESTSLYIGPISLLSHNRVPVPLFSDLLPGEFWRTSVLRKIDAQPSLDFPWKLGAKFSAHATYDEYFSSGEKDTASELSIDCVALEQVEANQAHPSLHGKAMKVRCDQKSNNSYSKAKTTERLEYWYLEELQLSFPYLYERDFPGDDFFPPQHESSMRKVVEISVQR